MFVPIEHVNEILSQPAHLQVIRKDGSLYVESWFVRIAPEGMGIIIHKYNGNDSSGMNHNHAWESVSFCLEGELREEYVDDDGVMKERIIKKGDIVYRDAEFRHSMNGYGTTLYIVGPGKKPIYWFYPEDLKGENGREYDKDFFPDDHGVDFIWQRQPPTPVQGEKIA
jgi:hypothetical protein